MAEDDGVGVVAVQACEQFSQALALCLGTCVCRLTVDVQSALIADTDGVLVVVLAVSSYLTEVPTFVYDAVACHIVMVANVLKAAPDMVPAALFEVVALPGPCGRAMQDNQCYCSHNFMQLCVVSAVSSAVSTVMMMSPMRRIVLRVIVFFLLIC